jgi:hypothetical protein
LIYVKADDAARRYEIWVPYEEREIYKNTSEYRRAVDASHSRGYHLTVFVGGETPLLPTITDLLDAQSMQ